MRDNTDCDCTRSTCRGGGSEDRIAWLDSRAAIRAAWVVYTFRGSLPSQDGLANNIHELRQSSKYENKAAGFIHNMDELRAWAGQRSNLAKHPLGRLSAEALEEFIAGVHFADYVKDGQRYQHIGGFYYGDLLKKYGFGYQELFEVFALFKMNSEYGVRSADRRPAGKVGSGNCIDWPGYSCPYEEQTM
jgi:hypothetical protein